MRDRPYGGMPPSQEARKDHLAAANDPQSKVPADSILGESEVSAA